MSKGYIYHLISLIKNDDRFYAGSTNDIIKRMNSHRNKSPSKKLKEWIKEVGWDNITYKIIKEFDDITKEELEQKEDDEIVKYLHKNPNCLNIRRVVNKRVSLNRGYNNTRYKNIWRCNLEGKKIEQYKTSKHAAEWVKNNDKDIQTSIESIAHTINQGLRGSRQTAYNYKWVSDTDDLPNEIWKEVYHKYIGGIKGIFVSTKGRIKRDNKITYGGKNHDYMSYKINHIEYKIHRLVALTFLPNFYGLAIVNHKDGDKSNNSLYNLEWISSSNNAKHAYEIGLNNGRRKKINQHDLKGNFIKTFNSLSEAAKAVGLKTSSSIGFVCRGNHISAGGFKWKYA